MNNATPMGKVAQRRHEKLTAAVAANDWQEVLRLLRQPEANYERKMRYHGTLSTNYTYDPQKTKELGDFIPDNRYRPDHAMEKKLLWQLFETLSEREQTIVVARVFENLSFAKIAERVGVSDKTAKKYYQAAIDKLTHLLCDFKG